MWTVTTDLVTALQAGLGVLMEPPISYMVVFGFVMAGLKFARGIVIRRKG